jgi:hypothetical protein
MFIDKFTPGAPAFQSCALRYFDARQVGEVQDAALTASSGCGNPTALADLRQRKPFLIPGHPAVTTSLSDPTTQARLRRRRVYQQHE